MSKIFVELKLEKISFLCISFLWALSGCDIDPSSSKKSTLPNTTSEGLSMNKLCDIPENLPEFSAYIYQHYGAEMSETTVKKLLPDFTVIKDAPTKDALYSRTEELRLVGLSKKCRAADGVEYEWLIAITHKQTGNPIFHQMYLVYTYSDIYNGKRRFNFNNFHGSKDEHAKLISKEIFGASRDEVAAYMKNLNARLVKSDEFSEKYFYEVDAKNDMGSRLGGAYFSKKITVGYDSNWHVTEVNVQGS